MIFNTINLNNTLGSSTNTYVNDVTSQLADDIYANRSYKIFVKTII